MKFSFVIPAYNNYKLLHQLLWDIYKNCSPCYEIVITDDGNDQETLDGVEWWKNLLPVRHFRHNDVGFLLNSNAGLRKARGDVLCLVSTDVRIHQDIVKYNANYNEFLWGGKYLDWDTGWNTFNGQIFPYVEGWLLVTHRENWEDLGYFDERYSPNDMEDVDLSTQAKKLGLGLCTYPEDYVSHIGAQTIGYHSEREELTKRNKIKFYEKWIA